MFVLTLPRSMLWWARPLPEGRDEREEGGIWTGEGEYRQRGDEGSGVDLSPYYAESSEPILGASSPCVGREISPRASGGERADA